MFDEYGMFGAALQNSDSGLEAEDTNSIIDTYQPKGEVELDSPGSSATIHRIRAGVVLKAPLESWWTTGVLSPGRKARTDRSKNSFHVEIEILKALGEHPRIVKYLGHSQDPDTYGILLKEASHGNLQRYLDFSAQGIDEQMRIKWCMQTAEAISYIHAKGVIHSDLRPENFLLDIDTSGELNILLCDFGGSTFQGLDGRSLPDSGFCDPRDPWVSVPATDIFSLGSMIYTITTGHWPYGSIGSPHVYDCQAKEKYERRVDGLFSSSSWPDLNSLANGVIIRSCWERDFKSAQSVLDALEAHQSDGRGVR